MGQSVSAYFLTFTTYGTWLHGRETGSVDRQHNAFETPIVPSNDERNRSEQARMRYGEYILDEPRRCCVLQAVRGQANYRRWLLWAIHVRSNHVHVVLSAASVTPERIMIQLKAWSSRRLRESFDEDADRILWTRHGSTRYLWDEEARSNAINYVIDRQGEPMAVFPRSTE